MKHKQINSRNLLPNKTHNIRLILYHKIHHGLHHEYVPFFENFTRKFQEYL